MYVGTTNGENIDREEQKETDPNHVRPRSGGESEVEGYVDGWSISGRK